MMILGACGMRRWRIAWYYIRTIGMLAISVLSWIVITQPLLDALAAGVLGVLTHWWVGATIE